MGGLLRPDRLIMNNIPPAIYDMAKRLIAFEALHANPSDQKVNATALVFDKLRVDLTKLAGPAGYVSLLSRALAMTRAQSPAFKAVEVRDDGTLEGLDKLSHNDGMLLVAQFLSLLVTFIGENLTLRVVRDIWPEVSADAADFNNEEQS
jgi:hypothetical protein